jgi:hypothetical protein
MKKILILLAFCTNVLSAQSPIFDTAYVISKNSKFYLLNRIEYDDNSYYEKVSIIGDTAQFYLSALQKFESTANSFANFVNGSYFYSKEITGAIRENNGITQITGKSPVDSLGLQTFEHLSDSIFRWTINTGTGAIPITWNKTANGSLRYTVQGSTAKVLFGFGKSLIRLNGFPTTGNFLDLYWDEGRKLYISQDGKSIVRRLVLNR